MMFYSTVHLSFQQCSMGVVELEVYGNVQPSPMELAQLALEVGCFPPGQSLHPTAWSAEVVICDSQRQPLVYEALVCITSFSGRGL